tara:strand:- start:14141 stop:14911 length:771 start_codon:yes stop_codon:yes gene_type:complete
MIHNTAIVSSKAEIDSSVQVGPYSIIDDDVKIDEGTIIESHVVIKKNTIIGKNNHIFQFASIGEIPQDLKFVGEESTLIVGDNNTIREYCTLNRGTEKGINKTSIGNHNLFMAYTHVAHDCIVNNNCIFSNAASLAGHVEISDYVTLGGFTLVHQYCVLGEYAFSGLGTVISMDVTPYTLVAGNHAQAYKINSAGLKRKGFDSDTISALEKAFKIFIKSKHSREEAMKTYKKLNLTYTEVDNFIRFIENSSRGVTR